MYRLDSIEEIAGNDKVQSFNYSYMGEEIGQDLLNSS